MSSKTLVVVGGGAAGVFCAVNAARLDPALKVIVLEKTGKLLSKVKVSGGGRCNVTHACFDVDLMSRQYPRGNRFVKKTFHQFFTTDTIRWFEERGVKLKTEDDGRMFPETDSSETIVNCLLKEVNKYKVEIRLNAEVKEVTVQSEGFVLDLAGSRQLKADCVCIACGGYARAPMFDWLIKLGHTIEPPVPSLFTFNLPHQPITSLMGISVENVKVKIAGTQLEQSGPLLITHWGLSGPAILKLSAWAARELKERNWEFETRVNWLPDLNEQELQAGIRHLRLTVPSQKIMGRNIFGLPGRLWEFLAEASGIKAGSRWADLSRSLQNRFIKNLGAFECRVKGKTTFKEEFVTAGGIRLNEIDHRTMMSKIIPGLFFAGEVMDVDAVTGGYNFQHAWTSGWIAAKSISQFGSHQQGKH